MNPGFKNTTRLKITGLVLVVFCLTLPRITEAAASANFFETAADHTVYAVNQFSANINFAKADLSSFFGQVKCFFGFGCETVKTAKSPKNESTTQTQSSGAQTATGWPVAGRGMA